MLDESNKDFLDTFCRAYLLEVVEETKYKDYGGLTDFIIHEATYEQVVLAVFDQKRFLKEQASDEVTDDIERSRKINQVEQAVKPVLGLSIAMIAGTEKVRGPVKQAILNLVKGKEGKIARFIKSGAERKGAAGVLAGAVISIALAAVTFLVSKIIFVTWEKSKAVCKNKCKQKMVPSDMHQRLKLKVCTSQCKVDGYKRMISKLRSEIAKCQSTENPERCQTTLVKHVSIYNDKLRKEEEKLRRLTAQLNSKASMARKNANLTGNPPDVT
jgi:hypothetical protein